jgi:hypothetical protein
MRNVAAGQHRSVLRPCRKSTQLAIFSRSKVGNGSIAHRRRLEVRPFGCSFPKPPTVIRQRPLPPNSAWLDEICERPLTKSNGHRARKVPVAGVGRKRQFDSLVRGRSSNASCWLASRILERLQWRFHPAPALSGRSTLNTASCFRRVCHWNRLRVSATCSACYTTCYTALCSNGRFWLWRPLRWVVGGGSPSATPSLFEIRSVTLPAKRHGCLFHAVPERGRSRCVDTARLVGAAHDARQRQSHAGHSETTGKVDQIAQQWRCVNLDTLQWRSCRHVRFSLLPASNARAYFSHAVWLNEGVR